MTGRPKMDAEITTIQDNVIELATLVEDAITYSVKAIKEQDAELARAVIDGDQKIDDLEEDINEACFTLLATQGPFATDLRYCVSIMKMIRDLERIGDHCEDMAKLAIRMLEENYYKDLVDIPRMAEMARQMVMNSISAFIDRDLRMSRKVWKLDEEADELFRFIFDEQLKIAEKNPEYAKLALMFSFIAAHLERIADYATNICEETVFLIEGDINMECGI